MTSKVSGAAGFTLLEVIVVIAIVGVLLTVGRLALPDSARAQLELEAARLVHTIQACRRGAVLSGVPGGVRLDADGYRVVHYQGAWNPADTDDEVEHRFAAGIILGGNPVIDRQPGAPPPQVVCLPDGETLFGPLQLIHRAAPGSVEIGDDSDGEIVASWVDPSA